MHRAMVLRVQHPSGRQAVGLESRGVAGAQRAMPSGPSTEPRAEGHPMIVRRGILLGACGFEAGWCDGRDCPGAIDCPFRIGAARRGV